MIELFREDIVSDVIEIESKRLIRALRGTGREHDAARYLRNIYRYTSELEMELLDRDVLLSELLRDNAKMHKEIFERPAMGTVMMIYLKRKYDRR